MSDDNKNLDDNDTHIEDDEAKLEEILKSKDEETRRLLDLLKEKELKSIKEKLNKSFEERDKANREAAKLREEARQREIKALEEAGKAEEALKARMEDLTAELEGLRKTNTELTRNQRLEAALSKIDNREFRNARSRDVAFKEIVEQLIQKEDGTWVHRTGISIEDFVSAFASDAEYEFLFRPLENKGSGAPGKSGIFDNGIDLSKGVRKVPPEKLIQLAGQGKLGQKKSF
jgi:hypothetical protein